MYGLLAAATLLLVNSSVAQGATEQDLVIAADTEFWAAYNRCDMEAMGALVSDDIEFYHDRTGLSG